MPNHRSRPWILVIAGAALLASFLLPAGDTSAAPATATYRGDAPAASGPGRRIELRLRTDGTMTWVTDYRNNRAPITEEGRWYPISAEEFDLTIESRDGKPVNPSVLRFIKKGDTLHTAPESADQFGSQGLQLKQVKAAAATGPASGPVASAGTPLGLWHWEGQLANEKLVVDQPDRYTLEIQPGGKALLRADCNRGSAAYKIDGRGLSFKLGALTRAACPPGSLSDRYLKALEGVVSHRTKGENLFLDLPAEGGTLKFVRAK
ncbi:MAG TPA: META domain-containing protein [Burkholderiales bacterium]